MKKIKRIMKYFKSVHIAGFCSDMNKFNDDMITWILISFEHSILLRFRNRDFPRDSEKERKRKKICGSSRDGGRWKKKNAGVTQVFFPKKKSNSDYLYET